IHMRPALETRRLKVAIPLFSLAAAISIPALALSAWLLPRTSNETFLTLGGFWALLLVFVTDFARRASTGREARWRGLSRASVDRVPQRRATAHFEGGSRSRRRRLAAGLPVDLGMPRRVAGPQRIGTLPGRPGFRGGGIDRRQDEDLHRLDL